MRPGAGALYRLDPGATEPVPVCRDITVSNGWAGRPTAPGCTTWTRPPSGSTSSTTTWPPVRRAGGGPFVDVARPGRTGSAPTPTAAVWVALWGAGAIRRYTPDGRLDREVEVPTPYTDLVCLRRARPRPAVHHHGGGPPGGGHAGGRADLRLPPGRRGRPARCTGTPVDRADEGRSRPERAGDGAGRADRRPVPGADRRLAAGRARRRRRGRPGPLADALVDPLRVRGHPVVRVRAADQLRPASLRLERGRTDPDSFYDDWLDADGLRREVLDPLGPGGAVGSGRCAGTRPRTGPPVPAPRFRRTGRCCWSAARCCSGAGCRST